jgi:hypothetical protein
VLIFGGVGGAIDVRQQGESVQYSVVEKGCSSLEGVGAAIDVRQQGESVQYSVSGGASGEEMKNSAMSDVAW